MTLGPDEVGPHPFDLATRLDRESDGVWRGTMGDPYWNMVGPFGGLVAVFRIDTVDHDAHTWSWSVRSGPLRLALDHGVHADGDGSRAWLVTHALWPVAAGYAPLARWALQRLVTP